MPHVAPYSLAMKINVSARITVMTASLTRIACKQKIHVTQIRTWLPIAECVFCVVIYPTIPMFTLNRMAGLLLPMIVTEYAIQPSINTANERQNPLRTPVIVVPPPLVKRWTTIMITDVNIKTTTALAIAKVADMLIQSKIVRHVPNILTANTQNLILVQTHL